MTTYDISGNLKLISHPDDFFFEMYQDDPFKFFSVLIFENKSKGDIIIGLTVEESLDLLEAYQHEFTDLEGKLNEYRQNSDGFSSGVDE